MTDTALNLVVIRSADLERAAKFFRTIGLTFIMHRHGSGPEHLACELGPAVFEVYPRGGADDATTFTRLGFKVASVDEALLALQSIGEASGPAGQGFPLGSAGSGRGL